MTERFARRVAEDREGTHRLRGAHEVDARSSLHQLRAQSSSSRGAQVRRERRVAPRRCAGRQASRRAGRPTTRGRTSGRSRETTCASTEVVPRRFPSLGSGCSHDQGRFFIRKGVRYVDVRRACGHRDAGQGRSRGGADHGGARAGPRGGHGQEGPAHGHHAHDGQGAARGAPRDGQAGQHRARQRRHDDPPAQGGAREGRPRRQDRRRLRRHHTARPHALAGHAAPDQPDPRGDRGRLLRPGLHRGGRPLHRGRLPQLHGAQRPGRPPQPRGLRHLLRRGQRARGQGRPGPVLLRPAAAHPDLRRAGARDGAPAAAHLHDLPGHGISPRHRRRQPPAPVHAGRGPGRGRGHHVRRPQGHAGLLHARDLRQGPRHPLPPALLPVH